MEILNFYPLQPIFAYISALTLTMSQPCLHLGNPIGVTGIDLHMEDIAQEITYYNQVDGSYAFMVNENGKFPQKSTFTLSYLGLDARNMSSVFPTR